MGHLCASKCPWPHVCIQTLHLRPEPDIELAGTMHLNGGRQPQTRENSCSHEGMRYVSETSAVL